MTSSAVRSAGFTLIELMITIAVVAILSTIAISTYSQYIQRARLTESFAPMTSLAMALEQYYQDNRTYVGACQATGNARLPAATASFTYACPTLTATTYVISASGKASTVAQSFQYTLNQAGARATPTVPSGWTTSATCWVLKKSGSCD